jgi:hypothetical protein
MFVDDVLHVMMAAPSHVAASALRGIHLNQLEAPEQVNSMIENFVRHYVFTPATASHA